MHSFMHIDDNGLNLKLTPAGLLIDFKSTMSNANQISLFRVDGARIMTLNKNSGIIDHKHLTSGLYIIRASNGKSSFCRNISIY